MKSRAENRKPWRAPAAVDACGDILWLASIRQGIPGTPPEAHLFKLAP